jgi:hypothetical protein
MTLCWIFMLEILGQAPVASIWPVLILTPANIMQKPTMILTAKRRIDRVALFKSKPGYSLGQFLQPMIRNITITQANGIITSQHQCARLAQPRPSMALELGF